jgi:hypothetical protein
MTVRTSTKTPQRKVLRCPNDGNRAPFLQIEIRADVIEPKFDKAMTNHIPVFLLKVIEKESEPDIIIQSRPPVGLVLRLTKELEFARLGVFESGLKREGVKGDFDFDFRIEFDRYQEQVAWLDDYETHTATTV